MISEKSLSEHCEHCNRIDPPKRCSLCHQARYCDQACQRADLKTHKIWCLAHHSARDCVNCSEIASYANAIPLHTASLESYDSVDSLLKQRRGGTSTTSPTSTTPTTTNDEDRRPAKFVLVAHAPFVTTVDQWLTRLTDADESEYDTIVIRGINFHFGEWRLFGKTLRLAFLKEENPYARTECVVCYETGPKSYRCQVCEAPACSSCIMKTVKPNDDGLTVACPNCRSSFFPPEQLTRERLMAQT